MRLLAAEFDNCLVSWAHAKLYRPTSMLVGALALGISLTACAPISDTERAERIKQISELFSPAVATTTSRMRTIAPQCVRHMRGQTVDVAALQALGYREIKPLFGKSRALRNDSERSTHSVQMSSDGCNVSGNNYILRDESLFNAIAVSLAPLGFQISRGNRIGLNNNATLLVADDMRISVTYPSTGSTYPNIQLSQR